MKIIESYATIRIDTDSLSTRQLDHIEQHCDSSFEDDVLVVVDSIDRMNALIETLTDLA